ncbi:MAG: hypothetical protein IJL69_00565, partial [Oscillospiraceae bacterium]|nr:hypothetical protein [Oscillospiraceae bacterium]
MVLAIPDNIRTALDVLRRGGFEGWLVGGCVRDGLMGKTPHDFDLTTDARPDELVRLFSGYHVIETGLKHGTVTVVVGGEPVEITAFRVDGAYRDHRHPETVTFTGDLSADLSRRDFTVNAMAYSPEKGLRDLFGGREDLARRVIRCVGEPDRRFEEDGLRILRAMRFASVLDFTVDPATAESMRRKAALLRAVSAERIFSEFTRFLTGPGAGRLLREFPTVTAVFLPELAPDRAAAAANAVDAASAAGSVFGRSPSGDLVFRLAALFCAALGGGEE